LLAIREFLQRRQPEPGREVAPGPKAFEISQRSKADPTARRLMTIPGVGPITSTAITALVPAAELQ
jgi:hypothetical protein